MVLGHAFRPAVWAKGARYFLVLSLLFGWVSAQAQELPQGTRAADTTKPAPAPKVKPGQANPYNNSPTDTGRLVQITPLPGDTARKDTGKAVRRDIATTINYQARDSIVFNVKTRTARMYGETNTDYGDINLKADKVVVDWTTGILDAEGGKDSTGKETGIPLFTQGSDKYQSHRMRYNFKTKRGLIRQVVTQQGDGYLHGETVKRQDDQNFFVKNAEYTTCNLEHPHFYIKSYKMKMVPGKKILSGPFNLYVADVPTPLGFAFGFFPIPKYKSSGIIFPTYGESGDRGFFLRNGGYYLALSPYFDLKLLGEIYSRGGFGLYPQSTYRKRYKYDGNVSFRYNRRTTDVEGPRVVQGEDFWLTWSHTPQTKGTSRFSASVNVGTNTWNKRNSFVQSNYFSSSFSSTVNYSKTFQGTPFSLNLSGRTQQNVQARTINIDLPQVSFNMNRIFPFRGQGGTGGKGEWYKNISVAYNLSAQNTISNQRNYATYSSPGVRFFSAQFDPGDTVPNTGGTVARIPFDRAHLPDLLEQAQIGIRHNIPVSTTFKVLRYFNMTPTLNYTETWYPRRLRYTYREFAVDTGTLRGVAVDTANGFSRFNDFSASTGLSTQIFGTIHFRRGRTQAIRHMIVPTLGFTYKPDFAGGALNYWDNVQVDQTGRTVQLNPFQGFIYGAPGRGKQAAITFGVNNTLEAKKRVKDDTSTSTAPGSAPKYEKKKLIDNFSFNFGYNLAADSFRLSQVNWQINRTFNRFTFLLNGQIDPYQYVQRDIKGQERVRHLVRTREYSFAQGQGIGKLTNMSLTLNVNLNPQAASTKQSKTLPRRTLSQTQERELDFINANPALFVDFNIPWSLQIGYNANYRPLLTGSKKYDIYQNLMLTGDVSLSENWKIGASAPYDFRSKKFSSTSINVYRNLHCWEMRFFVQVFGLRPMYTFDINVKASILQDLKLSKRNSFYDR